ncbi:MULTISPECIES: hypothetical protein [unclassified Paenibacillus]|jgi:hypothetical protein|nr:hypothetical protein [Paenibacillus sp. FSL H8-0259]
MKEGRIQYRSLCIGPDIWQRFGAAPYKRFNTFNERREFSRDEEVE